MVTIHNLKRNGTFMGLKNPDSPRDLKLKLMYFFPLSLHLCKTRRLLFQGKYQISYQSNNNTLLIAIENIIY